MKRMMPQVIGIAMLGGSTIGHASAPQDAKEYLASCLSLAEVKTITGLPLTAMSAVTAPQRSCSSTIARQ